MAEVRVVTRWIHHKTWNVILMYQAVYLRASHADPRDVMYALFIERYIIVLLELPQPKRVKHSLAPKRLGRSLLSVS